MPNLKPKHNKTVHKLANPKPAAPNSRTALHALGPTNLNPVAEVAAR